MRYLAVLLIAFGIYTCSQIKDENRAVFIKICRPTDTALQCSTYFFTEIDSAGLDSLSKRLQSGNLPPAKTYTGTKPDPALLRYMKKDTLVFVVK